MKEKCESSKVSKHNKLLRCCVLVLQLFLEHGENALGVKKQICRRTFTDDQKGTPMRKTIPNEVISKKWFHFYYNIFNFPRLIQFNLFTFSMNLFTYGDYLNGKPTSAFHYIYFSRPRPWPIVIVSWQHPDSYNMKALHSSTFITLSVISVTIIGFTLSLLNF